MGGTRARVDLVNVVQSVFDLWPGTIGQNQTNACHETALVARWTTGVGTSIDAHIEGDHSGGVGAASSPGQVCALINWSIAASYRGGHPRTYLPGIPEEAIIEDRYLGGGYRAAYTGDANDWLNGINILSHGTITGVELGTVAFFRDLAALAPPRFEPYQIGAAARTIATQRRRVRPR